MIQFSSPTLLVLDEATSHGFLFLQLLSIYLIYIVDDKEQNQNYNKGDQKHPFLDTGNLRISIKTVRNLIQILHLGFQILILQSDGIAVFLGSKK